MNMRNGGATGDGPAEAVDTWFLHHGGQIILQLDDAGVTNRYLWGPAVDQLLADEQVTESMFSFLRIFLQFIRDLFNGNDSSAKVESDRTGEQPLVEAETGAFAFRHLPGKNGCLLTTPYLVPIGENTAWGGPGARSLQDIAHPEQTILVVECFDRAVPWLEPRDIPLDEAAVVPPVDVSAVGSSVNAPIYTYPRFL